MNVNNLYRRGLRYSKKLVGQLIGKLKSFYCPIQQRKNHGFFAVNITATVGFFAQLNWCLYIFAYCERNNLKPFIRYLSPLYTTSTGDNWFEYFFENIALSESDRQYIEGGNIKVSNIVHISHLGLPLYYSSQMTIESANRLFNKYVKLRSEIQDYIEAFVEQHFGQRNVLGVHYRGTDKKSEAEPVSWSFCVKTIANFLDRNPQIDVLFVSSDEQPFIEFIEKQFKGIEICYHDDKERSRDGGAVHTRPTVGDNYMKGKEALVNCILLSRCNALIRTASFLSAWSSIFNPTLPVIMLNRPYADKLYFPDREVFKNSIKDYLPNQSYNPVNALARLHR